MTVTKELAPFGSFEPYKTHELHKWLLLCRSERRQIHNICDQLKLVHKSTGEGDSRRLVVTRVPITPDGVICVIPSVTPTSDIPDRSVNHSPTAPVLDIEYPQSDDRHVPPPTNIEPRARKRQKKLPTHLAIYQL